VISNEAIQYGIEPGWSILEVVYGLEKEYLLP